MGERCHGAAARALSAMSLEWALLAPNFENSSVLVAAGAKQVAPPFASIISARATGSEGGACASCRSRGARLVAMRFGALLPF